MNAEDIMFMRGNRSDCGFAHKLMGGHSPFGMNTEFNEAVVDESEMSIHFPFADGNRRDSVGDLLEVTGIDTSRHRRNPVVLFDHGKTVTIPVAQAENPKTRDYTVTIDGVAKQAWCKAFFYQAGEGKNYEHAKFCDQLFDMVARKYIRGSSIGYVTLQGYPLAGDPAKGIPQGMHLQKVLLLEASIVIMPANQDTVMKMLSLHWVCGKPMSPVLVKSLMSCGVQRKAQMFVSGTKSNDEPVRRSYHYPGDNVKISRREYGTPTDLAGRYHSAVSTSRGMEHLVELEDGMRYLASEENLSKPINPEEKAIVHANAAGHRVGDEVAFHDLDAKGEHTIRKGIVHRGRSSGPNHTTVRFTDETGHEWVHDVANRHIIINTTQNPEKYRTLEEEAEREAARDDFARRSGGTNVPPNNPVHRIGDWGDIATQHEHPSAKTPATGESPTKVPEEIDPDATRHGGGPPNRKSLSELRRKYLSKSDSRPVPPSKEGKPKAPRGWGSLGELDDDDNNIIDLSDYPINPDWDPDWDDSYPEEHKTHYSHPGRQYEDQPLPADFWDGIDDFGDTGLPFDQPDEGELAEVESLHLGEIEEKRAAGAPLDPVSSNPSRVSVRRTNAPPRHRNYDPPRSNERFGEVNEHQRPGETPEELDRRLRDEWMGGRGEIRSHST